MSKVAIYTWLMAGRSIGCGTQVELDHWVAEGVYTADEITLGAIIGYEPASEDERRKAAWERIAA